MSMNRGLRDALADSEGRGRGPGAGAQTQQPEDSGKAGHAPSPRAPVGAWWADAPERHSELPTARTVKQYLPVSLSH